MDRKFVSLFLVAVSLPVALAAGSANACDAPGTPTEATANVSWNFPPTITVTWTNTASNDETVFWDVEITDNATPPTPFPQRPGFGRGDNGFGKKVSNTWVVMGVFQQPDGSFPSVTRCFRLRARTEPGSQGCTSEIFGNRTCATTTAQPTISFPRALYAKNIDSPLVAPENVFNVPLTFTFCLLLANGCPVTPEVEIWDYEPSDGRLKLHNVDGACVRIGGPNPGTAIILSPCSDMPDPSESWVAHEIDGSSVWFIQNNQTQTCLHAVPGTVRGTASHIDLTPPTLVHQLCDLNNPAQQFSVADAEWVRRHAN